MVVDVPESDLAGVLQANNDPLLQQAGARIAKLEEENALMEQALDDIRLWSTDERTAQAARDALPHRAKTKLTMQLDDIKELE